MFEYRINTNTKDSYQSTINVTASGMNVANVNFNWTKSSGDFTLSVTASGVQAATITGNAKIDGQKLLLKLGQVSAAGQSFDLSTISITIDKDASIEKISGSAQDVFKMTEADVQDLINTVQSSQLGSLAMGMGGVYY